MIKMTGVSSFVKSRMERLNSSANFSALIVAAVFGVISPKIRMRNVSIPVAIPAPILVFSSSQIRLHTVKANEVEMEEADRFTMLLQIRMQLNIFDWFSSSFMTRMAALFLSSARARIFSLLTVVSAVSAEEKKADNKSSTTMINIVIASPGSKKITPYSV